MKKNFEHLLFDYKVDIAFWSHVHSYHRTCKVYNKQCREDGVMHIVIGTAGKQTTSYRFCDDPWFVSKNQAYGIGRVSVPNATHMNFQFVRNFDRAVFDSVWLVK